MRDHPVRRGWPCSSARRALVLPGVLLLILVGWLVVAAPARADEYVRVTDVTDPVPADTSYSYTITHAGLYSINDAYVGLTGATATITGVTSSRAGMRCTVTSRTSVHCNGGLGVDDGTITVTVLPSAAGVVTASAVVIDCCFIGDDTEDTTILRN
ncbi:hypothetical protein AB0G32_13535 [Streptomyces sp. NPDC023723]|uniref:hypothetical protein n=1 Tax=Streptomyces sp. NPDC023723 TaxID=3154323 RepID=UPI0033E6FB12